MLHKVRPNAGLFTARGLNWGHFRSWYSGQIMETTPWELRVVTDRQLALPLLVVTKGLATPYKMTADAIWEGAINER